MSDCHPPARTSSPLLPLAEAQRRIAERVQPVARIERVALAAAAGRVLAEAPLAPIDLPPYANSAMDGYAVNGADLPAAGARSRLTVVGTALAGAPFEGRVEPGQCVRIMTGAMLPRGADTVVMQEHACLDDGVVHIPAGQRAGSHIRDRGEDVAAGSAVLPAGSRLTPPRLALLAALGLREVALYARPRVAYFSTGHELRERDARHGDGQIYDANRAFLGAALAGLGVDPVDCGIVEDDRASLRLAFLKAAAGADAVISSGGVSVGVADYVMGTLRSEGEVGFWRIAMKPGKPLLFGRLGEAWCFGLPGNPVSAIATFYQVVQPALLRLMGAEATPPLTVRATLLEPLTKEAGRIEFQRGRLEPLGDGRLGVRTTGAQGSHILSGAAHADCFIVLPAEWDGAEEGSEVAVQPWFGLSGG